eukprot:comp23563_c0_seq1/m.39835 comp23563_c0_seq1/g.39835  ORF comp23563_c0_seq1/g.39835 comp23563_c0_seq1/m.39835 type:complete len:342 (-) comp23563_c0_seq1:176-1201(-)
MAQLPELTEDSLEVVREAIVEKLKEIDAYTDDVLPQYILVMVKNRKSSDEIREQLDMFLAENTDSFVDWLVERVGEAAKASKVAAQSRPRGASVNQSGDGSNKRKADEEEEGDAGKRARTANGEGEDGKRVCTFYPNCRNGDACPFYHPDSEPAAPAKPRSTKPCANFPYCSWGEECNFMHPRPNCRFGPGCRNMACPFNHPNGMPATAFPPAFGAYGGFAAMGFGGGFGAAQPPKCRFFPNCANPNCQFFHPVPCKFGDSCRNPNCQYLHTGKDSGAAATKATVPCKFGKSCTRPDCKFAHEADEATHISERPFVNEGEEQGEGGEGMQGEAEASVDIVE